MSALRQFTKSQPLSYLPTLHEHQRCVLTQQGEQGPVQQLVLLRLVLFIVIPQQLLLLARLEVGEVSLPTWKGEMGESSQMTGTGSAVIRSVVILQIKATGPDPNSYINGKVFVLNPAGQLCDSKEFAFM